MALDERLHRDLEHVARPADPSGVYEHLIRKWERRRVRRQVQRGILAIVVIVGSGVGVYGLSTVFRPPGSETASAPTNGLIAYSDIRVADNDEDGQNVIDRWRLYTVDPSNGRVTRIGPDTIDEALYPAWSPDGRHIAFVGFANSSSGHSLSGIFVADADGTNAEEVFRPAGAQQIEGIRWSPDGSRIGYQLAIGSGASSVPISERSWTIWTMAPDGTDQRQVTTVGREMHFSFSPDGTRIVFERFESFDDESDLGGAPSDLYLVDVDGSNEVQLTRDGVSRDPAWSPDGERIAFSHGPRGDQHVALIGVDGGGLRDLAPRDDAGTFFPYGNTVAWSPDGELIAFAGHGEDDDVCSISIITLSDEQVRRLVSAPAARSCPGQEGISWAPALEPDLEGSPATPSPSASPSPSGPEDPAIGDDLGLGFPVCDVSSIEADFVEPGVRDVVYVARRLGDLGGCPAPEDAVNVVALDANADGRPDAVVGRVECTLECRVFSAPDLDGDGTAELLVAQDGGAVLRLGLYDIVGTELGLEPVTVAPPGDATYGFEPGTPVELWLGGDEFELYTLRCVAWSEGVPGLRVTLAESLPHDSPDATWHAHEITFVLSDGSLHIVDSVDYEEPVDGAPSFGSGETLCGSNLGP